MGELDRPGSALNAGSLVVRSLDLADPRWDVAAAAGCLDEAERARAERGTSAVRRRRVIVRAALRRLLGGLLGLPPADVPLHAERGRPLLAGGGLSFSCSASGDVALLAVTGGPAVGVDVQHHRDDEARDAAAEGWLAAAELRLLAALPEPDRLLATTRAWTQKEAVLKARGTGIERLPTDVVTPIGARGRVGELHLVPVAVPAGSVASLATAVRPHPDLLVPTAMTPGGSR
ncbi:4'-phosphopantetheinyl transferase superfamily protein [Modestobacter sp. NPDC049651]|uniref:4'-phosphopantetheinyl transferase family protein n=1 Tax=unclassified Modestobacter TaxID=2643866 RepID=UPI0033E4546A